MSRIGKKPISIPQNVSIKLGTGSVEVKGPVGNMKQIFPSKVQIEIDEKTKIIQIKCGDDHKESSAFQGLTRSLIANAVLGVVENFKKELTIVGTGYNAKLKGKSLEIQAGFCHPHTIAIPEGLKVELPTPVRIIISGCDKQLVGQFAANVRKIRPVEPYKGKGIRYKDEVVKIKERKGAAGK